MRDERFYTGNNLNKWFAISSILFFISIVLTFLDDNDDDFKDYQREFRNIEIQSYHSSLENALSKVEGERVEYENKLEVATQSLNIQKEELLNAEGLSEKLEGKYYKANMEFLAQKAIVDGIKYLYESEIVSDHDHEDDIHKPTYKYTDEYNDALEKMNALKLVKETKEKAMLSNVTYIKELKASVKNANDELNNVLKEVQLIEKNLQKLDRDKMTTANKLGDIVRDLPVLDFMYPYYEVNQIVIPDIKYNVNFVQVPVVDRCTSCHLGIDKKGFEDAPQPYTTHPNLDLFLTSASPHPINEFGCTGCHAGRGRGTTFVSSVHMPNNVEDKERWEDEFDWKKMHHWLQPMLPSRYSEAGCFKCHSSQADIKGADKLTLGLTLIEKNGCYGCHTIEKYNDRRKAGPDLARINEKVNPEWTRKWIKDPRSFRHNTRMPTFFDQENNSSPNMIKRTNTEIYSIVEYLFKETDKSDSKNERKYLGDEENGKELFESVGCQGCHVIETDPSNEKITTYSMLKRQGPNLIGIGSKTSAQWVYNWIKDPKKFWPETRMPNLRLSDQEAKDITAYLMSFNNNEFENINDVVMDSIELNHISLNWLKKMYPEKQAEEILSGMDDDELIDFVAEKSIRFYGCFGCHNIPGFEDAKPIGTELTMEGSKPVDKLDFGYIHDIDHTNYSWFETKLENPRIFDRHKIVPPEDKLRMPNFYFQPEEIEAIVTALMSFTEDEVGHSKFATNTVQDELINTGRRIIKDYNCQGCHIIDDFGGQLVDIIGAKEFSPPNLNTQGAKTQADWLFDFFKDPMIIRPNLRVRMPSFDLNDEQWNAVIKSFQYNDGQEMAFESEFSTNNKSAHFKAGKKLEEFGECKKCHFYGTQFPDGEAQTWAPNLALSKERLRPEWILDWLRDPQKIMPGTKMPAPFVPTEDLLTANDAIGTWGKDLVNLKGNQEAMLEGLRDVMFSVPGKTDISKEIKRYFDKNGYDFLNPQEEQDDEDEWDDDDW